MRERERERERERLISLVEVVVVKQFDQLLLGCRPSSESKRPTEIHLCKMKLNRVFNLERV